MVVNMTSSSYGGGDSFAEWKRSYVLSESDLLFELGMNSATVNTAIGGTVSQSRPLKIVFVGDSGVGKSSFIHRFCRDEFKPYFASTMGVDYQTKTLVLDRKEVKLELWDTSGQERFRSLTKQYFRRADGVVAMYDVTSPSTFTNIRNWMASLIEEGVCEGAITMLLGNKCDLAEGHDLISVDLSEGLRLAEEYGSIFHETSALNGKNVKRAMGTLARALADRARNRRFEDGDKLTPTSAPSSFGDRVKVEDSVGCCG